MSSLDVEIKFEETEYIVPFPISIDHALPVVLLLLLTRKGDAVSKILKGSLEYTPLNSKKFALKNLQVVSPSAVKSYPKNIVFGAKPK